MTVALKFVTALSQAAMEKKLQECGFSLDTPNMFRNTWYRGRNDWAALHLEDGGSLLVHTSSRHVAIDLGLDDPV